MNKRLVTLIAALSAFAGVTAASAADLPVRSRSYAAPVTPVAAFSWTGFYIGGNVGYGWGKTTGTAANAIPAVGNFDIDGAFGGVQGGYNWQFNNWVVGIEADYQWGSLDGSKSVGIATDSAKLDRFGTVRGRIGYAWDRWMVYGTGGYAFEGNMRYSFVAPAALAATNRQSLDRVIPDQKIKKVMEVFDGAGWHVVEAKYGSLLTAAFQGPGGDALRAHIDAMSNEEYQSLFAHTGEVLQRMDVSRLPSNPEPAAADSAGTSGASTTPNSSISGSASTPPS